MVGFGFWEKEEEKFLELFSTIKIEGRIVKEEVTAQNCKYSSSNWMCTFNGAVFVTFIWTALVSRGDTFFFCGLLYLVIFFIFPKVLIYQELKDTWCCCLNGKCCFQKCFLPQTGNNFMEKSSWEAEETKDKLPPAIWISRVTSICWATRNVNWSKVKNFAMLQQVKDGSSLWEKKARIPITTVFLHLAVLRLPYY